MIARTGSAPLALDGATLLSQLQHLGTIGADPGGGRTRLALTDADRAGRDQLVAWMQDLDLDVQVDRIGNIFGTLRRPGAAAGEPALMIGSHIDTVINAGALDGCYGVLAGLAVARAFRQAGGWPQQPLVIAAFTNEEGVRYQPDMLGSLVYAGGLPLAAALDLRGTDGTRLGDELARIGYAGERDPGRRVPRAYLELHVEQGPILEAAGLGIGVVENLQGISWQRFAVQGSANHAGTTPLGLRHDAGYVAARVIVFLRDLAAQAGRRTLATVGTLEFVPNAINVIPGRATFSVDLRDPDDARLAAAEQELAAFVEQIAAEEGVTITAERLVRFPPVVFDAALVAAIEAATVRRGLGYRRMTSGAGHDAQMMARLCPAAMIFVPSRGGISHNPAEDTPEEELITGAEILLEVVAQLDGGGGDQAPSGHGEPA